MASGLGKKKKIRIFLLYNQVAKQTCPACFRARDAVFLEPSSASLLPTGFAKVPLLPPRPSPTPLHPPVSLSLALTQWAISVAGGFFISTVRQDADTQSGPLCCGGQRTCRIACERGATSESRTMEAPFSTKNTRVRSEASELARHQSTTGPTRRRRRLCLSRSGSPLCADDAADINEQHSHRRGS